MKFLFYSLLILAPLPFGSARPVWQLAWVVLIGIVVVFIGASEFFKQKRPITASQLKPLIILSILVTIFLGWLVWAESLKDCAFYEDLASVDLNCDDLSKDNLQLYSLYIISHLLIFLLFAIRAPFANLQKIINVSAIIISGYCLYALAVYYSGSETILWFDKWTSYHAATGTFVNRNHFATYAALGLILSITGLILNSRTVSDGVEGQVKWFAEKGWLNLLLIFICLISLLLSSSRGGWIAGIFSAGLLTLGVIAPKLKSGGRGFLIIWGAAALLILIAISLYSDTLFHRFVEETVDSKRLAIYATSLEVIQNNLLHGVGVGRFNEVFDLVRPEGFWKPLRRAHNEYLEILFNGGIIALFLSLTALAYINANIWKKLGNFGQPQIYKLLLIAINSLFLLHSLVDFPLQIPALSMLYMLLLGAMYYYTEIPDKSCGEKQL